MNRRETIRAMIEDLVTNFLYYDRKEDEALPVGEIEVAVKRGEVTVAEMVEWFKMELEGLEE